MTGEEFRSQYQVGERITEPPVVTHRALDRLGSPVLVHYLLGSTEVSSASILERVNQAGADLQDQIREIQEVEGIQVVVTKVIPGFSALLGWLDAATPGDETPAPEASPAPGDEAPAAEESPAPGAYTQLFRTSDLTSGPGAAAPEPTTAEKSTPAVADLAGEDSPEEHATAPPETDTPPPVIPELPRTLQDETPGSYTMLFGASESSDVTPAEPAAPEESPDPADSTPSSQEQPPLPPEHEGREPPGSYTMLFGKETVGIPDQPDPEPPPSVAPPAPEVSHTSDEASTTGLLGEGVTRKGEEEPPPPVFPELTSLRVEPPSDVGAQDLPKTIAGEESSGRPADRPAAEETTPAPGPDSSKSDQPGAYTQIFGGIQSGAPPPSRQPPPYSPPPPPPPPPLAPQQPAFEDQASPDWKRWKDTPGASGGHIPSDSYLQHLNSPTGPGSGPSAPSGSGRQYDPVPDSLSTGTGSPGSGGAGGGPGHYTMVREGLSTGPAPGGPGGTPGIQPAPPAAREELKAEGPRPKKPVLAIVGLTVIVLAIVALIVVFAVTS